MTVHGAGLGLVAFTAMAREGQTGCEETEWESETSVRCMLGHGAEGTRRVTVTAGERSESLSLAFSVDLGSISMMRRKNSAGTGSASVTVHGSSLGLVAFTAMLQSGHTGCEATEWESETSMRCLIGYGAQSTRRVVLTTGERSESMSQAFSIDLGSMSVMRRENSAGTGSLSVTVHGSSLGLVAFTAIVRSGQTGCEATEWESESSVRCLMGRGAGGTRRVTVTAGERAGTGSMGLSVDLGDVSLVSRANRAGTDRKSVV